MVKYRNALFLGLILLAGLVLRCMEIDKSVFFYDEVSAILRTNYSSFSELIEKGVVPDGHPAGMQVLIWIGSVFLFMGNDPISFKIISILVGLLCVVLVYLIAQKTLKQGYRFIPVLMQAIVFYNIYWDRQIRPYTPGLFFVLLFYYFLLLLKEAKQRQLLLTCLAGIAAAGAFYLHYFAALAVVIILGIQFAKVPEKKLKYQLLFIPLLAFVLYLPHLSIFSHQLGVGGVGGWLGKPGFNFLPDYLFQLFNRSWILLLGYLGLLGTGIFFIIKRHQSFPFKHLLIFVIPILIGYIWSWLKSPVLQHNVLQFTLPFLWIFTAEVMQEIPQAKIWKVLGGLGCIGLVLLNFSTRKLHVLNSTETYRGSVVYALKSGVDSMYFYGPEDVWTYHKRSYKPLSCIKARSLKSGEDSLQIRTWKNFCEGLTVNTFSLHVPTGSPSYLVPLLLYLRKDYGLAEIKNFPFLQVFRFEKKDTGIIANNTFLKLICLDYNCSELSKSEIGKIHDQDRIVIETSIVSDSALLVAVGKNEKNKQISWISSSAKNNFNAGINSVFLIIDLADYNDFKSLKKFEFKLEKTGRPISEKISNCSISLLGGNPYRYGY